jgi:hypothetical protein
MHFTGMAKQWLQSVEDSLTSMDWPTFCTMIHERFSRDQHELILCQLFHIKQTSTITDYVEEFTKLVDQLKSYNPKYDTLSLITHFVDGLRINIHAMVLVARPSTLDVACTLALLQEEAAELKGPNWPRGG